MPKLYSYIRWSSERQAKGTSLERQMESAKAFALANGLELVEIIDPGVSAFRGKNTQKGKLGDFIDAVRQGVIPADSWLYVEHLDRITRQNVTNAQKLFIEILELGLTLVTGMDKRSFTLESVNENPTELMISILLFSRSNEESKTKQSRTISNVKALVERYRGGEPVNIKSCGKHPFWIDDSGPQNEAVREHTTYWDIAREAIDLFLQGHGIYKVKRYLDENYPDGLNGKEWDYQVLKRLRENRALIGERTINIDGQSYKLQGYYPSLCKDEAEFIKLQELKIQNGNKSKKDATKDNIKLLSGLSILRCNKCGGTMAGFMNRGKPRYICLNGRHLQKGCVGWSITAPLVDHCVIVALLIGYMDASRQESQDTSRFVEVITAKQDEMTRIDKTIENIARSVELGVNIEIYSERLKELSANRDLLLMDLDRLKKRKILVESKGSFEVEMTDFLNMIQWGIFTNPSDELRNDIRKVINSIIELVVIDKTDGCITIKIKCRGIDNGFVFRGENRKPYWKFAVEPIGNDVIKEYDDELADLLKNNDSVKKALHILDEIRDAYTGYYETVKEMLSVIGYPEIDGSLFWPNR
ncbi:recombinase family protein [Serratia sp. JSRIV006]|uniref:recombinase family protein n=1 Tax=Serratia sp. JSRIV006 TaxID=2831896 RepID=UPI001CC0BCC6|nr:recombinase family protein [Serratia sp. JSRIV006]UAN64747.1 recombinase family protein [Serratia sp. JSRIV006]